MEEIYSAFDRLAAILEQLKDLEAREKAERATIEAYCREHGQLTYAGIKASMVTRKASTTYPAADVDMIITAWELSGVEQLINAAKTLSSVRKVSGGGESLTVKVI